MITIAGVLGEGLLDGVSDLGVVGRGVGSKAVEDVAVAADEELLEVPEQLGELVRWGKAVGRGVAGKVFAPQSVQDVAGCGGDERGVEGMLAGAGDRDLGEKGKGDGVLAGAEVGDLLIGARLLAGEIVGGKPEDDEAPIFVPLVDRFERRVLRGETAFAGDVHDEEYFAGVVGERGGRAGDGGEGDGGEGRHGDSLARCDGGNGYSV